MSKRKMTRNERIARKLMNMMPSDINCEISYNRYQDCVTAWISIPIVNFKYLDFLHPGDSDAYAEFFCETVIKHIRCNSRTFNKRNRRN